MNPYEFSFFFFLLFLIQKMKLLVYCEELGAVSRARVLGTVPARVTLSISG
jgi:hypothetical protein